MKIIYMGFIQRGMRRCYYFDGVIETRPGHRSCYTHYSMTADMAIINRMNVKIQDLPALCLHTLCTAVGNLPAVPDGVGAFQLTEADVHAYSTPAAPPKPARRPLRQKPGVRSQIAWRGKA
jgi:hypothetical protein